MAYPPTPMRRTSFRQAENAGLTFSTADLDSEINTLVEIVSQLVARLKLYTAASGQLTGLSQAIAAALAGANRFVATVGQTVSYRPSPGTRRCRICR